MISRAMAGRLRLRRPVAIQAPGNPRSRPRRFCQPAHPATKGREKKLQKKLASGVASYNLNTAN
jgi:hypothetical protein